VADYVPVAVVLSYVGAATAGPFAAVNAGGYYHKTVGWVENIGFAYIPKHSPDLSCNNARIVAPGRVSVPISAGATDVVDLLDAVADICLPGISEHADFGLVYLVSRYGSGSEMAGCARFLSAAAGIEIEDREIPASSICLTAGIRVGSRDGEYDTVVHQMSFSVW
jgi:hypothetical protein